MEAITVDTQREGREFGVGECRNRRAKLRGGGLGCGDVTEGDNWDRSSSRTPRAKGAPPRPGVSLRRDGEIDRLVRGVTHAPDGDDVEITLEFEFEFAHRPALVHGMGMQAHREA